MAQTDFHLGCLHVVVQFVLSFLFIASAARLTGRLREHSWSQKKPLCLMLFT